MGPVGHGCPIRILAGADFADRARHLPERPARNSLRGSSGTPYAEVAVFRRVEGGVRR